LIVIQKTMLDELDYAILEALLAQQAAQILGVVACGGGQSARW
jgi:hypothetical protein